MKIGVFDSGIGGKSVADAIITAMPKFEVIFAQDKENVPYGTKSPEHLLKLVTPILQNMIDQGCEVLVIACNTVTTTLGDKLRKHFTVPIVGIEPMIKPAAALTVSNIIAVCATPATLHSERYKSLVQNYVADKTILEPDCSDWALMIEDDSINHERITQQITHLCMAGADVIVLGCTHYHWIEEEISDIARAYNAIVLQPETAIVARLRQVIAQLG